MTDPSKLTDDQIASLAATVRAPESLHRRVQAMVDAPSERNRRGRRLAEYMPRVRLTGLGTLGAATAGAAVAGAALALSLALSGSGGGLTVEQAAALTLRSPTMAPPRESRFNHAQLQASVEGVPFPYWRDRFGWASVGARMDRVGGRSVTTVFYTDAEGHRIGYAIAAGRSPKMSGGTIRRSASGIPYRISHENGATVVAWPRRGHLCVVAGRGMDASTLLRLAGWHRAAGANA